jgi:hypothetical protein
MVKNALHLVIIDRANLPRVLFVVRHFISSFTYASGALCAGKAHFCDAQRLSDSGQESHKTVRDCVVPIYRDEAFRSEFVRCGFDFFVVHSCDPFQDKIG